MLRLAMIALLTLMSAPLARAQEFPIQGVAALEILPGYATQRGHMLAARIRLKKGWKTYWRAPGGNGIPPRFNWSGSRNLGGVTFHWPAPGIYVEDGVRTIGYKDELVLPIEVTPAKPGHPMELTAKVDFGICEDVCIPVTARFRFAPDDSQKSHSTAIKSALANRPAQMRTKDAACALRPTDGGFALSSRLRVPGQNPRHFVVVEYDDDDVWVEPDGTKVSAGRLTTQATLYGLGDGPLVAKYIPAT